MLLGEALHLLGRVLGIAHVVVWHDRDHADPALLQLESVPRNAVGDRAHVRTVITSAPSRRSDFLIWEVASSCSLTGFTVMSLHPSLFAIRRSAHSGCSRSRASASA